MMKKLKPAHPGEILWEEFMLPLRLVTNRVAMDLRVPVTRIADIVNEKRAITTDTALRSARYFNNSPTFWMMGIWTGLPCDTRTLVTSERHGSSFY
jgi:antitoxin HigA-1